MPTPIDIPESFDPPLAACLYCGSASIAPYDRDLHGHAISRCGACGIRFLNPQYTDAYLARFYGRYIADAPPPERAREREAKARVHHDHLGLVEAQGVRGRLLSVGCGSGVELAVARERGWQAEGYDVDPETVRRVAAELSLPIRCGDFLTLDWAAGSFDCVYLHHVLEHPKNPREYLARIRDLLKPGGILFVASPNIGSLSNRFKTLLGKAGLKPRRGKHYDTWHHLSYFSPGELGAVLESKFGFTAVLATNGVRSTDRARWPSHETRVALARALPCISSIFVLLARRNP